MISAPTNPVSINCVGTGVLDRPLIQQNLRTVREADPYAHRDRLCEIKEPDKPEFVERFINWYINDWCFNIDILFVNKYNCYTNNCEVDYETSFSYCS